VARILTAAEELLLSWGYRRVTIDAIARRAQVGKGTIYLHWKTKEELFVDLMRRSSSEMLWKIYQRLVDDPTTVYPHRYVSLVNELRSTTPVLQAIFTSNIDILGSLVDTSAGYGHVRGLPISAWWRTWLMWNRDSGFIRSDQEFNMQYYALGAVLQGFFSFYAPAALVDREDRTKAFSMVIGAFECPEQPCGENMVAAARDLAGFTERWARTLSLRAT
jgi:AcrR family transcriptional regulator